MIDFPQIPAVCPGDWCHALRAAVRLEGDFLTKYFLCEGKRGERDLLLADRNDWRCAQSV
jgi:hypothetical protein